MKILFLATFCLTVILNSGVYSQKLSPAGFNLKDLKETVANQNSAERNLINTPVISVSEKSQKSPGLALLFSLIVPGAGQFYINRMDVGKYYLGADIAFWIGYGAMTVYSNNVYDQAQVYSVQHASIGSVDGKDEDFFSNIGSYDNVYEYNNDKLARGEYQSLYDVQTNYWDWDNMSNMNIYESQRKSSERISDNRIIFGSLLIVNRIVSGISAYLLTQSQNKKKSVSFNIEPELMYKKDYSFDGVKINLSKNF